MPSLYLEAGAIHGCVLCKEGEPVCYTEDVGRHNAVDKIAGWMFRHNVDAADNLLYTTGRLTSEMVIRPCGWGSDLVSRSGFTAWVVDLAREVGLTLVGRERGKRFIALAGQERIVYDQIRLRRRGSARQMRRASRMMKFPPSTRDARRSARGGLARRMGGGDKPMRTIGGRTSSTASSRGPHFKVTARFQRQWRSGAVRGLRVLCDADAVEDFPGRLAGFLPRSTGGRPTARMLRGS